MAEYIDREAVYVEACRGCIRHGENIGECYSEEPCQKLIEVFALAPAAEVAPVVRCKACKHAVWDEEEKLYLCTLGMTDEAGVPCGIKEYHHDLHYCSYGERRANNV